MSKKKELDMKKQQSFADFNPHPRKEEKKSLSVSVPVWFADKVENYCKQKGLAKSWFMREAVFQYMKNNPIE